MIGKKFEADISRPDLERILKDKIRDLSGLSIAIREGQNIKAVVDKYGFLDLEFDIFEGSFPNCSNPFEVLRSEGIIQESQTTTEKEAIEEREMLQLFLEDDVKGMLDQRPILKVFARAAEDFDEWKAMKYRKNLLGKLKMVELKSLEFTIVDACITNFPGVWISKYFYM